MERTRTPKLREDERERSTSGLRDISIELKKDIYRPLGSGAGVGDVNSVINSKYQMDLKL
jgi:hypothetical protein